MGNIKKLKKVVNQCLANDWLEKDPFHSYKIKIKENHRLILSEDELKVIRDKTFNVLRLEQVKDIFIFSCYTGLSYADLVKLTPDDLIKGIDGKIWIVTIRTKTDT
ncbi:MAG: site-specific integrase, partial [Bacteroidota bacterium]|nr:site-specific integrase [Bacteroidota bacterium]